MVDIANYHVWDNRYGIDFESAKSKFGVYHDLYGGAAILPNYEPGSPIPSGLAFATRFTVVPLGCGFEYGKGVRYFKVDKPIDERFLAPMLMSFGGRDAGHLGIWDFIQGCVDEDGQHWVVIYASSFMVESEIKKAWNSAMLLCRRMNVKSFPRYMAYLPASGLRTLSELQKEAQENRSLLEDALGAFVLDKSGVTKVGDTNDVTTCGISLEHHAGISCYVHRNNAVRIGPGESGIVLGGLSGPHHIVKGKGCLKSFHSCPSIKPSINAGAGPRSRFQIGRHFNAIAERNDIHFHGNTIYLKRKTRMYMEDDWFNEQLSDFVEIECTLKPVWWIGG